MLPIDIIKTLHSYNAIYSVEMPSPDMNTMLEKFGMIGMKQTGEDAEFKQNTEPQIISDLNKLLLRREFILTTGNEPSSIVLTTDANKFRKRLYIKFDQDKWYLFNDEINDKDVVAICLRTAYIDDVKVSKNWLQIASKGSMLAIELPSKEAYEG